MKLFNKIALLTMLIITCMVGSASSLYSQNETGTRNLNDTLYKATHSWYDSTTAMFQHQFPIIRSIPPLNTSMPLDVLISYIYLDSLLRSPASDSILNVIESQSTLNDTLKYAAKFLFTLNDYNPIILKQYANEVGFQTGSDSGLTMTINNQQFTTQFKAAKYHVNLSWLRYKLADKIYQLLASDTATVKLAKAYYAALYSNYILRVKVISIDSIMNKLSPFGMHRYKVTAQVVDTIIGKIIPALTNNSTLVRSQPQNKTVLNDTSSHYMTFEYVPNSYHIGTSFNRGISSDWDEDSSFIVSKYNHEFTMRSGQEAVVFLTFCNPIYDNQYDYFNLDVESRTSYNALPIIGGSVRDINHVWSDQTLVSYNQWLLSVQNLIAKIKNRNY
jgi:hypothetical protein